MKHNKLVRDRIPEILNAKGISADARVLDPSQLRPALVNKLREEVEEFCASDETEELADVLEVIYSLARERGVDEDQLNEIRRLKRLERGGFEERIFLIEAGD